MKRIIGILVFLFLSNSIASFGSESDVYISSTLHSTSTKINYVLIAKKSSSALFEKSSHHKSPIKPKKKKKSKGVEPVHYFICDLREQFVFNSACSNSNIFFFSHTKYHFSIPQCHNERGPPTLI